MIPVSRTLSRAERERVCQVCTQKDQREAEAAMPPTCAMACLNQQVLAEVIAGPPDLLTDSKLAGRQESLQSLFPYVVSPARERKLTE